MKLTGKLILLAVFAMTTFASCKKYANYPAHGATPVLKTVKFELFTTQDFSSENKLITFTMRISRNGNYGSSVVWDSVLAPMKVKDIPDLKNKIVATKTITADKNEDLSVGFYYYLENVGYSWKIDVFKAGETSKTLTYDFR